MNVKRPAASPPAPEEVASQVALEATDRIPHAFALAEAAIDVGNRRRVMLVAADDDGVQGAVELAITAGRAGGGRPGPSSRGSAARRRGERRQPRNAGDPE